MSKRNTTQASTIVENQATTPIVAENPIWKTIFWATFGIVAMFTLYLATQTGINADEDYQAKYSESLMNWYDGKDVTAESFERRGAPMYIYGGFFEVIAGATNKILGNTPESVPYHNARHILVAIFGLLTMFFTAMTLRRIVNWRAATIALLLIALSPYFLGNAIMNPKDIPFAAGFAIALYYIIRFFQTMPDEINWKIVTGLAIGFALAFGTRAGGILLFAYFGLFTLVHVVSKYGLGKFFADKTLLIKYLKFSLIAAVGGYVVALLFWPFGLIKPLSNPFVALAKFEELSNSISVLYKGETFMSNEVPTSYALRSLFQTTPLIVLFGLFLSIPLSLKILKRHGTVITFIVFFSALFPIAYVMMKHSNMYNQWRHLLFVYPGVIALTTLAINALYEFLEAKNKNLALAFLVILGLGAINPLLHIVKNQGLSYIYYNEAVGGVKPQLGNFETDYWGISMRQGIEYLEKQGVLKENMDKPVTIVSNMGYALEVYTKKYGDKVKWVYADYKQRYNTKQGGKPANLRWDYGLFISLFVPSDQLRVGSWPMKSATIHTVEVAGTPVLAVMQQDTAQRIVKARENLAANNLAEATTLLEAEVAAHPDNEIALSELAECQLNGANFAAAKATADLMLKIAPQNKVAYYFKGLAQAQMQDTNGAISSLKMSLKCESNFAPATELLGKLLGQKR
jgi:tetratricopeptide (TPR) repeat protein